MLVIRLQRTGRENTPTYRIVVAEKARPVKGKFLEIIGHYLPARDPAIFEHNDERIAYWVGRGAIPSDTMARLLKKAGIKDMEKFIQRYAKQKSKNEQPEAPAAPAPAVAAAPVAETPAPEAPVAEVPAPETPAEPAPETPAAEAPVTESTSDAPTA